MQEESINTCKAFLRNCDVRVGGADWDYSLYRIVKVICCGIPASGGKTVCLASKWKKRLILW